MYPKPTDKTHYLLPQKQLKTTRLLLPLLLAAASLAAGAQDHIRFMGIPLSGTVETMALQLQEKGLQREIVLKDGTMVLRGTFAQHPGCQIFLLPGLTGVGVNFPDQRDWTSLEETYLGLKTRLTGRYGQPLRCIEEFSADFPPDDPYLRLEALRLGRCHFESLFAAPGGEICLYLNCTRIQGREQYRVMLHYRDKANTDFQHFAGDQDL